MFIDLISIFDKVTTVDASTGFKTSLEIAVVAGSQSTPDLLGKMTRYFNFKIYVSQLTIISSLSSFEN